MTDEQIIDLYWQRDERAIVQTQAQYGPYCYAVAHRILHNSEDAEESVNDAYLPAWNSIPPKRPPRLNVFLGKITRNLAINRVRSQNRQKRGGGQYEAALEELDRCLGGGTNPEQALFGAELKGYINEFLQGLPRQERRVFIQRYWQFYSIAEIAEQFGYSAARTRTMLYRTRNKLRTFLEKRGVME